VPQPSAKALDHYRSSLTLLVVSTVWNLAAAALFLISGASARVRTWALDRSGGWYGSFVRYALVLVAGYYVLNWPIAFYGGFIEAHRFGLSTQSFARWQGHSLKQAGVMAALALAAGWIPFQLARRSPRWWWLFMGLLCLPLICLLSLVQPVVIDPLFNHFQPLQNRSLEAKILALAARAGIRGGRVWQVDKSADTTAVNAYVTGFLGSKRIVLWDTTLRALDEDEVLFIMGHEMGHYVLHHVARGIVVSACLALLALLAIHLVAVRAIRLFAPRFGFRELSDLAAAPLAILLLELLTLLGSPVAMAFSRHQEHEADRFALELTRRNHAGAMSFLKIQHNNLAIPRPGWVVRVWLGSHPCLAERIEFCNGYRPWEQGRPGTYDQCFQR